MRTPSPALLVATLALIVAATGTAGAAAWINGSQIRPHSITSLQLAKGAVTAKAVRSHAITKAALADGVIINNTVIAPTGPKGDAGAAGANGVAAFDPSRITAVVGPDVSVAGSSSISTGATCPGGSAVVGGGYSDLPESSNSMTVVTGSHADSSNGWQVAAREFAGLNQPGSWHAIAYCAA